ncbi:MAG: HlyC/CorC family transporter [Acidimicrobiia bacterium]|nr:HlyC/CorC family transporter [Acidimicrobiia bacterium]
MLILLTAFFVAGEFALVAVDRTRIEQLRDEGSRRARGVLRALDTLTFQLSGAQFGITVCALLLGVIAEPAVARLLVPVLERIDFLDLGERTIHGIAVALALVIVTILGMVIGELMPKNFAITRPVATALAAGRALRVVNTALKPLIVLFDSAANRTSRVLGFGPHDETRHVRTLEELDLLMRLSAERGVLEDAEYALLHRSIAFAEKAAADALVPRTAISALPRDATIDDLIDLAFETGHSRFPVFAGDLDDVVGIVHVKDAYQVPDAGRARSELDLLMQPAYVIPETLPLRALLVAMRTRRTQMAIVIDEYGGTAGLITLEDILEEIVGEIEDEYDTAERVVVQDRRRDVWVVDGMLHHDELAEITSFELPEGEWETLAGFLLDLFQRIPGVGDIVEHTGWRFEVVEMEKRRIARVRIRHLSRAAPSGPVSGEAEAD